MQDVLWLGAGLSGLGFARELPGTRLFEARSTPGGHCAGHELEGVSFDEGAHICHSKDEQWLASVYANAKDVVKIPQSRVSNYWHGTWATYPVQNHLHDLPLEQKTRALIDLMFAN